MHDRTDECEKNVKWEDDVKGSCACCEKKIKSWM